MTITGKFYEVFISKTEKLSIFQNMFLCTAISLACAFYQFDTFIPVVASQTINAFLTVLLVVCWLWCSFISGFWNRYSFLVYTAVFWIIPRLIIMKQENTGILDYNKYLDAASQISRLTVQFSLSELSDFLGTPVLYLTVGLLVWCLCFYFLGRIFKLITRLSVKI
ncbi:MAG: hypothetical protein LBS21_07155 [Clostridiales bacterium]|jgi:hypothetical protein|nr:hypothetical protein [Clostridiales bacterium]